MNGHQTNPHPKSSVENGPADRLRPIHIPIYYVVRRLTIGQDMRKEHLDQSIRTQEHAPTAAIQFKVF